MTQQVLRREASAGFAGLRDAVGEERLAVRPALWAFGLTFTLLAVSKLKAPVPILLADRFLPGAGWLQIGLLSAYAAWLAPRMLVPSLARQLRPRIWLLFTVVFFGQLALGLLGLEQFLMTGKLHLPVPALIAAGPIYRGEGFFMVILFLSTVALVGPAWCSHLCYVGSWDEYAARGRKRPEPMPGGGLRVRVAIAVVVLGTAAAMNRAGVGPLPALVLATAFGLLGVLVMLRYSRRRGQRVHCTMFCPMGLIAGLLGKLNPFRIRIADGCTECRACERACRCAALDLAAIRSRRPYLSCTLCGDCVAACRHRQIDYRLLWLEPARAREVFYILVVALHAAFLGVARI